MELLIIIGGTILLVAVVAVLAAGASHIKERKFTAEFYLGQARSWGYNGMDSNGDYDYVDYCRRKQDYCYAMVDYAELPWWKALVTKEPVDQA